MPLYISKELAADGAIIQTLTGTKQHSGVRRNLSISLELSNYNLFSPATFQPCRVSGFAVSWSISHRGF